MWVWDEGLHAWKLCGFNFPPMPEEGISDLSVCSDVGQKGEREAWGLKAVSN